MDGALPSSTPSNFHFSGDVRQYYIVAEQELWDYVPTGWDNWLGVPINVSTRVYLADYTSPQSPGLRWEKALYRCYTGATFSVRAEDAPTQGIKGPALRAEVGDMIEILFVNKLEQNYASMHSMRQAYIKANEDALYPDATGSGTVQVTPPLGDVVAPGDCVVYKWLVDNGSSPSPGEPSHMWGCHSYNRISREFAKPTAPACSLQYCTWTSITNLNAGLTDPSIVYPRGQMNATMAADREFIVTFVNFDESWSFISAKNGV
jgi:manganese oxidase